MQGYTSPVKGLQIHISSSFLLRWCLDEVFERFRLQHQIPHRSSPLGSQVENPPSRSKYIRQFVTFECSQTIRLVTLCAACAHLVRFWFRAAHAYLVRLWLFLALCANGLVRALCVSCAYLVRYRVRHLSRHKVHVPCARPCPAQATRTLCARGGCGHKVVHKARLKDKLP